MLKFRIVIPAPVKYIFTKGHHKLAKGCSSPEEVTLNESTSSQTAGPWCNTLTCPGILGL